MAECTAIVTLQSLPMTESPAGKTVPVLQSLHHHVDVSHPMTKSPPL